MENNEKWLIAIDLDGTTTMSKGYDLEEVQKGFSKIHPLTAEGIRLATEAGHIVVINTGRSWSEAKIVYDKLDVSGWIINCAGAHIHNVEDESIKGFSEGIPKWVVEEIRDDPVLNEEKVGFTVYDGEKNLIQFEEKENAFKEKVLKLMRGAFKEMDGTFDFDPMFAHLVFKLPEDKVNELADYTREKWGEWVHVTSWGTIADGAYNYFEINAAKNNKGTAIEKLAKIHNIPMERTMAMGDAENDIGAFEVAAEAVCMINGSEYMKTISTQITELPNYEGGLGDFLIKFFNLK